MLTLVYKKITKNKWMFLSMLIGFVLSTAMLSSIPIYTQGITRKVLIKDMENYQVKYNKFPVAFNLKVPLNIFYDSGDIKKGFSTLENDIENKLLSRIKLPTLSQNKKLILEIFSLQPQVESLDGVQIKAPRIGIYSATDFEKHIDLKHGKVFSTNKEKGIIEVIATEQAMQTYQFILNNEYTINCTIKDKIEPLKIKVVGVFINKSSNDSYWSEGISEFDQGIVMDYSLFKSEFLESKIAHFIDTKWYSAYDYHSINIENVNDIMSNMQYIQKWSKNIANGSSINAIEILEKYNLRQKTLKVTLIVLEIPVVIMLIYYIFMISQLIIDQDKKEIAVLKSRGAGRGHIIKIYLLQGVILSGFALLFGPLLGLLICNLVGSANGFMEFVQRSSLHLKVNFLAYIYSACACVVFTLTMLLPAIMASKTTIVQHTREKGRVNKQAFYQKYYLDVVLFLLSCYGYYAYKSQQKILNITGASGMDIPLNPMLFAIVSVFIIALGLIFLRVFPYVIKFMFKVGEKKWSPSMYSSLINLSRSGGKNTFLIIFLIITVSTGIFSANSARTINTNIEEKERYGIGADITIFPKWETSDSNYGDSDEQSTASSATKAIYREPEFKVYENLEGVDTATKVIKGSNIRFSNYGQSKDAKINVVNKNPFASNQRAQNNRTDFMAVVPNEFGKVAWFRTDLLQHHWYNYLNFLTNYPNGLLVSSSMAKQNGINLGDDISVDLGSGLYFTGTVMAFIDYWPSYNPYPSKQEQSGNLIVANFNYLQALLPLMPYEIWIKKKPKASSTQIYNGIIEKKLEIISLQDSSRNIIDKKNDPIVQGTNGALTLGFIVNLFITLAGFLIFWILGIKARVYQFGVLRAMGLFSKEVIKIIFSELLLLSLASIFVGVSIGKIASKLFVPLLQVTGSASQYVPPFRVTENFDDYVKLYIGLFLMLVSAIIVLSKIISKININQALKLGED